MFSDLKYIDPQLSAGADLGLLEPESYIVWGVILKEKNIQLQIKNYDEYEPRMRK